MTYMAAAASANNATIASATRPATPLFAMARSMSPKTGTRKTLVRLGAVPLQNRVTPFGEVVAIEQRGLLMGNRGIIHDPATRTLLNRRWTNKAWIICVCDFRGVRRQ